ncbi:hypothetical protein [Rhizohabitans arisaemae]|uniref:hypothetical protein n=1 Tax=Rhizohabitans arisaemae TaxID=2720610 RepID=UPI0024B1107D|nr:hypothetical protein [Rhizohabitans arisaemae]
MRVYQAMIRDAADRLGPRLRGTFATWFRYADDGAAEVELNTGGVRVRLHDGPVCGRYIADTPDRFKTTVSWGRGTKHRADWCTIAVDSLDEADPELDGAPGFVPAFLRTSRATDGSVPLESTPHEIDVSNLGELLAWLTDQNRRVPVVVLTPDPRTPNIPAVNAARLAEALSGIALIARLRDQATQDKMNAALGESLVVFGGGLRTYLPELRVGGETYPHRHAVRSGNALRELGPRALDVVISAVTRESVRRALPEDVKQATRLITGVLAGKLSLEQIAKNAPSPAQLAQSRLRDRLMAVTVPAPAAARTPVPEQRAPEPSPEAVAEPAPVVTEPPVPATADPHSVLTDPAEMADRIAARVAVELRGEILAALEMASGETAATGVETRRSIQTMSAHMSALRRELDQTRRQEQAAASRQAEAEDQTAVLESELDRLRKAHDQLELDYEELADEERRARERIRWLEGRLAELSQPVYDVATPKEVWRPETLMDVLLRARDTLTRLNLPEPLDNEAAKLDITHPGRCRLWAGKTWDALQALDAYATARTSGRFHGGFYDWCVQPPPGLPSITLTMLSMRESEAVSGRPKFRDARTFRVPAEVDPSGGVFMQAHVRLQRVGYPAPRMYFHDDAGGPTGKIWIGYLGEHLPNTRTN